MRPDETLAAACAGTGAPLAVAGAAVGTVFAVRTGRIIIVPDLGEAAAALGAALADLGAAQFTRNDPRLDVSIHRVPGNDARVVVFVCTRSRVRSMPRSASARSLGT